MAVKMERERERERERQTDTDRQRTNSVKALKVKSITFHRLAHPKLIWELSNHVFDH